MKNYTIPIFIPQMACPHQCVFCNQKRITERPTAPCRTDVIDTIEKYMATIPAGGNVEIGFLGGSFTAIPIEKQQEYLETALPYLKSGRVSGLHISTRPDAITPEIIDLLIKYRVRVVELGCQSMDEEVLRLSERGHSPKDTAASSKLIMDAGISLGLQMMIGLPGDSLEKDIDTAKKIIALGADSTRIYPALVIKDTALADMYEQGTYRPLGMQEAIDRSKVCLELFESASVKVLRIGLHPSEGLLSGESLLAGPFHQSFRELVLTEIWSSLLAPLSDNPVKSKNIVVSVPPSEYNYAVGYCGKNRDALSKAYGCVRFVPDKKLKGRDFFADYSG